MTNQILKALEPYRGKGLFYDVVGPAATGAAVARVAIDDDYVVPSAARELVGVIPFITTEEPAAAESIISVGDIIGPDFRGQPCEFPFPVAAGMLGALNAIPTTPAEFWAIHAPMDGGEVLNFGQEMCDALAADGEAGLTLVYTERRTGKRQIFGKFSREVAGGAGAGADYAVAGDNLTISNGGQMYEIVAICVFAGIVTTVEALVSLATMKCSVWDPIQSTRFFLEPVHAMVGASGAAQVKAIMRLPFDARFNNKQATVETTFIQSTNMTVAPMFVHGIRYYGS